MESKREGQPGPDPERLKIEGDWEDATDKMLRKKRPSEGWPEKGDPDDRDDEKLKKPRDD